MLKDTYLMLYLVYVMIQPTEHDIMTTGPWLLNWRIYQSGGAGCYRGAASPKLRSVVLGVPILRLGFQDGR